MSLRRVLGRSIALAFVFLVSFPAWADNPPADRPSPEAEQRQAEAEAAWKAAGAAAKFGPTNIGLLDEADVKLPADEAYVPAKEAERLMVALGNSRDPSRVGLIVPHGGDRDWMILIRWVKEGYVRDGDAKDWQADELLTTLRDGTEAQNEERIRRGIPALDIIGWVQPPTYDATAHRLVWSLSARNRGEPADAPQTINYNTYALGRDGYFSLDLLTDSGHVAADMEVVNGLLAALTYRQGKRYDQFDPSTDKVAAYGLAALVGAVAVKKLGLLAMAGVFLLKIWKVGLIALLGFGAAIRRFFTGRGKPTDA